jgi:SAM-dependent methyltransferase
MDWLLRVPIARMIRRGNLRLTTARGTVLTFLGAELGVLLEPELKLGEAYMDGSLVIAQGSIADLLEMAMGADYGRPLRRIHPLDWSRLVWRRLKQLNLRGRARRNVAHHYDLDERLYALFLDSDRQYSCAYFDAPSTTLDDAQLAKKRHLAAKLRVAPDARVLDIGCGWGGLALYLAEHTGAQVTGITLSKEQLAQVRASEKNLTPRIAFRLQDYRDVDAAGVARALPRPSRDGGEALRPALRAHVGVLPGGVRDGVRQAEHDGDADPDDQASGYRADHARLHRGRGRPAARGRRRAPPADAARRRVKISTISKDFGAGPPRRYQSGTVKVFPDISKTKFVAGDKRGNAPT